LNDKPLTRTFFAIIGKPVKHARSPLLQNTALRAVGLAAEYIAVEVEPEHLERDVRKLVEDGCAGFNITIPHKQAIIPLLSTIDNEAKHIGAVNTVVIRNGSLHGYNTDVYGFRASLAPYKAKLRGANALLLGAGGAARTVAYSLVHDFKPERITIAARTREQAQRLADTFSREKNISFCSFDEAELAKAVGQATLVVNATPVGMHPHTDASPLHASAPFHRGQIVFDLIYTPLQTTLLKHAVANGATTINGLEMLLQQGARAFELFTGKQMLVDVVRKVILKSLE